jgi:hypothetical protein
MRVWDWLEQTLVGLLGLAALGVGMWQIFGRYLDPSLSSGWGDEVIVYLVIWAIMIVSSQLVRHDAHVRPDIVLRLLRPARPALAGAAELPRRPRSISAAPIGEVIRGILPFLVLLLIVLGIITYVPALTLWLPGLVYRN